MNNNIIRFPKPIRNLDNNKNIVAVLGKLETMHKGHLKLIAKGRKIANAHNAQLLVMLFSERTKDNFYSFDERIMFANKYNPEYYLSFEPNPTNFKTDWKSFNKYLSDAGVTRVVCGHDFRYGKNREGGIDTLWEDFKVYEYDEIFVEGRNARTSELKKCVENDDLVAFKEIMGHYFFYKGIVKRGKKLGRQLGMPTINVEYPRYKLTINEGIYFSYVIYDGRRFPSLTSISTNPSVNDGDDLKYETYIYDFDKEIYGEEVYVEIIDKIRDPIKTDSLEELKQILDQDKKLGEKFFKIR